MKQFFRGVVWPRDPQDGKHRYVVVGMLVTDEPLSNLQKSDNLLNGAAAGIIGTGLAEELNHIEQVAVTRPLGDATNVLLNLKHIVEEQQL